MLVLRQCQRHGHVTVVYILPFRATSWLYKYQDTSSLIIAFLTSVSTQQYYQALSTFAFQLPFIDCLLVVKAAAWFVLRSMYGHCHTGTKRSMRSKQINTRRKLPGSGDFFGTLAAFDFRQLGELSFMQYYIKCLDLYSGIRLCQIKKLTTHKNHKITIVRRCDRHVTHLAVALIF